jgi:DNA-binding MarR family transcriptional regulator
VTLNTGGRAADAEAVLNELVGWTTRERMDMFRRWVAGSLSIVHLHVLTILESDAPLPMGKLAEALDVSIASATGIIDRMEQRGLVERGQQADDRRVVLVQPTVAGLAVFSDLDTHRRAGVAKLLDRMTDAELAALLKGLRAMTAARAAVAAEAVSSGEAKPGEGVEHGGHIGKRGPHDKHCRPTR